MIAPLENQSGVARKITLDPPRRSTRSTCPGARWPSRWTAPPSTACAWRPTAWPARRRRSCPASTTGSTSATTSRTPGPWPRPSRGTCSGCPPSPSPSSRRRASSGTWGRPTSTSPPPAASPRGSGALATRASPRGCCWPSTCPDRRRAARCWPGWASGSTATSWSWCAMPTGAGRAHLRHHARFEPGERHRLPGHRRRPRRRHAAAPRARSRQRRRPRPGGRPRRAAARVATAGGPCGRLPTGRMLSRPARRRHDDRGILSRGRDVTGGGSSRRCSRSSAWATRRRSISRRAPPARRARRPAATR